MKESWSRGGAAGGPLAACRQVVWPHLSSNFGPGGCRLVGRAGGRGVAGGGGRRWFLMRVRRVGGRPSGGRLGCSIAGCGRGRGAGGVVAGRIARIGGVAFRHAPAPVFWRRLVVLLAASR
jgi:hypothetical protein